MGARVELIMVLRKSRWILQGSRERASPGPEVKPARAMWGHVGPCGAMGTPGWLQEREEHTGRAPERSVPAAVCAGQGHVKSGALAVGLAWRAHGWGEGKTEGG